MSFKTSMLLLKLYAQNEFKLKIVLGYRYNKNSEGEIMIPTKSVALQLLNEAHAMNPGPWKEHSIVAAECAYKIAKECADLDEDKAYVLGLLHDIGRRFGVTGLAHVIDTK